SCHEVTSELFVANAPNPPHCTLNSCFGVFCTIWIHLDCLVVLQNSMENGPNWCKSSCHVVASYVFASNTPDCPRWVLNSYFGAFRIIWVHLVPFGCLTKLGGKRAEVVQKFVPRSRVRIFCNEHTRSTPLDPKLKFLCVLYYLGPFGTVWLPYETRRKTSRASAKVCATKSLRNFSQRMHPIHHIGP